MKKNLGFIFIGLSFLVITAHAQEVEKTPKISEVCKEAMNSTHPDKRGELWHKCKTAIDLKSASGSLDVVGDLWMLTSGVCLYSCLFSWTGVANNACKISAGTTLAYDLLKTKEWEKEVLSLLTGALSSNISLSNIGIKTTTVEAGVTKEKMACKIVASTFLMGLQKKQSSKATSAESASYYQQAASVNSQIAAINTGATPFTAISDANSSAQAQAPLTQGSVFSGNLNARSVSVPPSLSSQSLSAASGDWRKITENAVAFDPSLPQELTQPQFKNDFEKMTGQSVAQYLSDPSKALKEMIKKGNAELKSSGSESLSNSQSALAAVDKLAEGVSHLAEVKVSALVPQSNSAEDTYSSTPGSKRADSLVDNNSDSGSALIENFLKSLNSESQKKAAQILQGGFRKPSSLAPQIESNKENDLKSSLFERVNSKYLYLYSHDFK